MEISSIQRDVPIAFKDATPAAVAPAIENRALVQAVKAVNSAELLGQDKEIVFEMDRRTRKMITRVVDRATGEVVSQLPTEHVLRLAEELMAKR